ncbi:MAG: cysteine synthase A [Alistipes timonensis]|nr:cysteine synthase A [Alistipes timonensis]
MKKIYSNLTELIGHTPLMEAQALERAEDLKARLLLKIESFNPGGSAKDRVALAMIQEAERSGALKPGGTIIEPTSGNTGIGLAWVATVKGYRLILTMPDTMSVERRNLLEALGATLVLTPGAEGMKGAIAAAEKLRDNTPGAVILQQFSNPANPAAHRRSTGIEIWSDTDGEIDIFVAGVGTGGTISGVGATLKEIKPAVKIVAVEPATSAVLGGGAPGAHKIQGIGAGFIPANYDASVVDEVVAVTDSEAAEGSRLLARTEGLLAGISSGAALTAALREARLPDNEGKTIVVLLPDTGERYLSTPLFTPALNICQAIRL